MSSNFAVSSFSKLISFILIFVFVAFYTLSIVPSTLHASESNECKYTEVTWTSHINTGWTADPAFGSSEIPVTQLPLCSSANSSSLGFTIPSLGDILTFFIRAFFAIAGISALFYLLLGAFAWITSGGDKDSITSAREKIQAAIIGLILIVAVLALIWTLEQVVFAKRICLGVSCPVTIPGLIKTDPTAKYCCTCVDSATGNPKERINTYTYKCDNSGNGVKY